MKIVLFLLSFPLLAISVRGQFVVHDPLNHVVNTATQINAAKQHIEVLKQGAESLEKLNDQLREARELVMLQRRVRDVMGDPVGAGSRMILDHFGDTEFGRTYGETLSAARRLADAAMSLRNTVEDTYAALDDNTSMGRPFARDVSRYRRYAVVERQAATVSAVQEETEERRLKLQRDLGRTVEALRTASTQAEADKLRGMIDALNGQIGQLHAARRQEADRLHVLQILNENQAAKERQDLWEKQAAEERHTLDAVNGWQRGLKVRPNTYR